MSGGKDSAGVVADVSVTKNPGEEETVPTTRRGWAIFTAMAALSMLGLWKLVEILLALF